MAGEVLVKVEGLSKKFCKDLKTSLWYGVKDLFGRSSSHEVGALRPKEFWAVRDINFELRRGECLGLIGHNGAGKSTLLKILNGLINPDEGQVTMRGRVGALIELGAGFNPILTGRENIYNNGAVLGFTRKEIDEKIEAIIDFSEIREFIDMPVQNYSSGMKVRLGFAVAAQMKPDVLIVDEVLAVGDIGFRFKCLNAIGELMKDTAVIFVTHSMPMIFRVCNKVMLLHRGQEKLFTADVGKGIEKYYAIFPSGKQNIVGSGEAHVIDFKFSVDKQTAHFGDTLTVPHGSDLHIEMIVKLDLHIKKAALQLVFWNQEMMPVGDVLDTNLQAFLIEQNQHQRHNVTLTIPKVNFNAGKHAMSVMINSPDFSSSYCRLDNAGFINMTSHFASGAHILINGSWSSSLNKTSHKL
ncbi:MAG: ABC transporter ATP-binding protein [Flavobacteriaceae bacterium]|uniref:ABC transporter ATP-binding protein n=1 Tax=Phaeodactylibacter xiamenensis TaxID=1524460 RepID=UPI000695E95B|nr:ABC transporter ATP-binding protein [Phaeodactylibacter xiamenensis]MCR9265876.1 ABC transporter ATP-binding protein [Flavobacteriaceae bacterium]